MDSFEAFVFFSIKVVLEHTAVITAAWHFLVLSGTAIYLLYLTFIHNFIVPENNDNN